MLRRTVRRAKIQNGKQATAKPSVHVLGEPVQWAREVLGFTPDAQQEKVLRSDARRGILNCTRQWGKSTVTSIKALHYALSHPESLVIVVSPSGRQSAEFLRKIKTFARSMGLPTKGDGQNPISLKLDSGSRIVGLPSNEGTVRGFSAVGLLLIDEAARVKDEMFDALTPMLAVSDGTMWLMSTPCGKRGFFYNEWHSGEEWEKLSAPATACSRISQRALARERRRMSEAKFRQEYLCEFVQDDDALFDEALVRNMLTYDVQPLWSGRVAA